MGGRVEFFGVEFTVILDPPEKNKLIAVGESNRSGRVLARVTTYRYGMGRDLPMVDYLLSSTRNWRSWIFAMQSSQFPNNVKSEYILLSLIKD